MGTWYRSLVPFGKRAVVGTCVSPTSQILPGTSSWPFTTLAMWNSLIDSCAPISIAAGLTYQRWNGFFVVTNSIWISTQGQPNSNGKCCERVRKLSVSFSLTLLLRTGEFNHDFILTSKKTFDQIRLYPALYLPFAQRRHSDRSSPTLKHLH